MYKIQTLNAISPLGLNRLPKESFAVGNDIADPDALLVRSANLHTVAIPDSVLCIGRAGAGTNNIPVPAMSARGVPVFNTPGANANAVKELVLAGMLLGARNINAAMTFSRSLTGTDEEMSSAVEKGKKQFVGFELPGKILGVIGLGAIGVQVANAATALGMRVLGFDPAITIQHAWQLSSGVERAVTIEEVFKRSDIVTVHVPLVEGTKGLIGAHLLGLMKSRATVLNFSRGPIVDEQAMLAALDAGKIRGYICDFPSVALQGHPRVVALPHLGASTNEAEENCAVMAADELKDYLANGNITNSVNFPDAFLPRTQGTTRIALANQNVPSMVSKFTTLLGDAGLNIQDLLNKSRGELAYTMIDVQGEVSDALIERLRGTEGVIGLRVL